MWTGSNRLSCLQVLGVLRSITCAEKYYLFIIIYFILQYAAQCALQNKSK